MQAWKLKLLQVGASLGLACAAASANAVPYTIDGSFLDWEINAVTLRSATAREQTIEDQHTNYLDPGYGGQTYDAEGIYLDWDANYLYVGILTGMPKTNPHNPAQNTYGPGDIILDFDPENDTTPELALKVITRNGLTSGGLYEPGTWDYGLWQAPKVLADSTHPSPDVVGIKTGTQIGTASLAYSTNWTKNLGEWANDKHYFIEAKIPTSAFASMWMGDGPKVALEVYWAAMCGNDIISVDPAPVSEPGLLGLLGLAVGPIVWHRRRTKK